MRLNHQILLASLLWQPATPFAPHSFTSLWRSPHRITIFSASSLDSTTLADITHSTGSSSSTTTITDNLDDRDSSTSGNNTVVSTTLSPSEALAFAERAKKKLLSLVPHNIGADGRSEEDDLALVARLISALETVHRSRPPIETVAFFNLLVGGEWDLVYSDAMSQQTSAAVVPLLMKAGLQLRSIRQNIIPYCGESEHDIRKHGQILSNGRDAQQKTVARPVDTTKGIVRNDIIWELRQSPLESSMDGEVQVCMGRFSVICDYAVNRQGHMALLGVREYVLKPFDTLQEAAEEIGNASEGGNIAVDGAAAALIGKNAPPGTSSSKLGQLRDPAALCALLERAVPAELFLSEKHVPNANWRVGSEGSANEGSASTATLVENSAVTVRTTFVDPNVRIVEVAVGVTQAVEAPAATEAASSYEDSDSLQAATEGAVSSEGVTAAFTVRNVFARTRRKIKEATKTNK